MCWLRVNLGHDLVGVHTGVVLNGLAEALWTIRVGLVAVAQHEDVIMVRAERVIVKSARPEQHFRVLARCLLSRAAVEVPDGQLIDLHAAACEGEAILQGDNRAGPGRNEEMSWIGPTRARRSAPCIFSCRVCASCSEARPCRQPRCTPP